MENVIELTHHDMVMLFLRLCFMLFAARMFAELARKLKQPAVVGEIIAGILLGPTVFGMLLPELFINTYGNQPGADLVIDGLVQISVVLLLFIAGLEVELNVVWNQGRKAAIIAFFSVVVPLLAGFAVALNLPVLLGMPEEERVVSAMFFGLSISITGLAVLARILIDLEMFKTKAGLLMIAAAMIIDVLAWVIFSIILSVKGESTEGLGVFLTIGLTLGFTFLMLTAGKGVLNKILPWINQKMAWPGGLLSISLALCFLAAAFTESIGIHATFGAFIMGVALGDSQHMTEKAKEILHQFINNIFAPIFFISIGIKLNFIEGFNPGIVGVIVLVGWLAKVYGSYLGSKLSGIKRKKSLVIGVGLNSRGSVDIVLALIALEAGLISEPIFIGLVVLALLSSLGTAPLIKWISPALAGASGDQAPEE